MREDLLGYLLGALEPHEMRRVDQLLRDDPSAREELAAIELLLRPLEEAPLDTEPPPAGLIERTLAKLPPVAVPMPEAPEAGSPGGPAQHQHETLAPSPLPSLRRATELSGKPTRRWVDWVGGAISAAVLLCLLIPTLAEGRFAARRAACQNHLRQFGAAITQFVMLNQQHRLPQLAERGPEAFAGMYAIRLRDAGLLDEPQIRLCPSRSPADLQQEFGEFEHLVRSDELHSATPEGLVNIQYGSGGQYAYSLGVVQDDQYVTPRYEGRSFFAVMSDAPTSSSFDAALLEEQIGHDGRGINVLYEDGRVAFLPVQSLRSMPDHPFLNDRGDVEAGVNIDDAVLAPSWQGPFLASPQR